MMVKEWRVHFSHAWQNLRSWLNGGRVPYVFTLLYLASGTLLVYASPRSLPAFLLFVSSAMVIFYLKMDRRFKIGVGVIVPGASSRRAQYFLPGSDFQISVFCALALG
jgi:hypothetical protein